MPEFIFNVPLSGEAVYSVEAETLQEACKLLAIESEDKGDTNPTNKYLIETDHGWELNAWTRGSIPAKLEEHCEV